MTNRTRRRSRAFLVRHVGHSMHPTLCQFDAPQVAPCDFASIRIGDVIAFRPPGGADLVVHRVVARESEGLRTAGDNCPRPDPWLVGPQNLVGRVTRTFHAGGERRIHGGAIGLAQGGMRRLRRRALDGVRILLRKANGPIFGSRRRLPGWLPRCFRPKIVELRNGERRHYHVVLGRRIIGRWHDDGKVWKIRAGFRFLCAALPAPHPDRE